MEKKGKQTTKKDAQVSDVQPKKMSKIAEYWASKPNKGTIVNMRAVLK